MRRLAKYVLALSFAHAPFLLAESEGRESTYLYCQMSCRGSDLRQFHAGAYPTDLFGNKIQLESFFKRTPSVLESFFMHGVYGMGLHNRIYAQTQCEMMRDQLVRQPPLRLLIRRGEIDAVSANSCEIYPRLKSSSDLLIYGIDADSSDHQ